MFRAQDQPWPPPISRPTKSDPRRAYGLLAHERPICTWRCQLNGLVPCCAVFAGSTRLFMAPSISVGTGYGLRCDGSRVIRERRAIAQSLLKPSVATGVRCRWEGLLAARSNHPLKTINRLLELVRTVHPRSDDRHAAVQYSLFASWLSAWAAHPPKVITEMPGPVALSTIRLPQAIRVDLVPL